MGGPEGSDGHCEERLELETCNASAINTYCVCVWTWRPWRRWSVPRSEWVYWQVEAGGGDDVAGFGPASAGEKSPRQLQRMPRWAGGLDPATECDRSH